MSYDDPRPVLSLLDRLLDDDPGSREEPPIESRQLGRSIREGLRRDVEDLLNTRRRAVPVPAASSMLAGSIACYGVADLVGADLASRRQRERFLRGLATVLREHEPRFDSVRVVPVGDADRANASLAFRIEAVLRGDPEGEALRLASRFDPVARAFEVGSR